MSLRSLPGPRPRPAGRRTGPAAPPPPACPRSHPSPSSSSPSQRHLRRTRRRDRTRRALRRSSGGAPLPVRRRGAVRAPLPHNCIRVRPLSRPRHPAAHLLAASALRLAAPHTLIVSPSPRTLTPPSPPALAIRRVHAGLPAATRRRRRGPLALRRKPARPCPARGAEAERALFGIVSSIVDVSSQRTCSGRPAALPDGYGLGTRTGCSGSSLDTGAGGELRVYVN